MKIQDMGEPVGLSREEMLEARGGNPLLWAIGGYVGGKIADKVLDGGATEGLVDIFPDKSDDAEVPLFPKK